MRLRHATLPLAGVTLLLGLAGSVALMGRAEAQGAAPRFVYGAGAQGVGYYRATGPAPVVASRTARPRTVGLGARDWSTGRRQRLHKPWMHSRG